MKETVCLVVLWGAVLSPAQAQPSLLRHSAQWLRQRLEEMVACDLAYLDHEVLGGRAIHQNSLAVPPTKPHEGNFVPAQQAFFAIRLTEAHELLQPGHGKWLKRAEELIKWVCNHAYDPQLAYFYFKYNQPQNEWQKVFYPEFNAFTIAAVEKFHTIKPVGGFLKKVRANRRQIIRLAWDQKNGGWRSGLQPKADRTGFAVSGERGIYAAGYLALNFIDAHRASGDDFYLLWARRGVDFCNEKLWDDEFGGWFISLDDAGRVTSGTKFTHVIADLVIACMRLHRLTGQESYREKGLAALEFLIAHSRDRDGGWYRHNTRDGLNPGLEPQGPGDRGPGTAKVYDRNCQVIVALIEAYRVTGRQRYLTLVDDTFDWMERALLIDYPVGKNYGYTDKSYQNTWCHLWGLQAVSEALGLVRASGKRLR